MKAKGKRTMRDYESIFQDALGLLIKHHPFFGHIMLNIVRTQDNRVHPLALSVNDKAQVILHYNLEDIKKMIEGEIITLKNLTAMIQHTIYHLINEHFLREADGLYDAYIVTADGALPVFAIASDMAINQYIDDLPSFALNLDSFKDLRLPKEQAAEIYYRALLDHSEEQKKKLPDGVEMGDAEGILIFNSSKEEPKAPSDESINNPQIDDILDRLPFDKNQEEQAKDRSKGDDNDQ